MKQPVTIGKKIIQASVPVPPEIFECRMEQLIDQLPRKERYVVKRKISVGLVLALLLMLAAITAVALGLGIDEIWAQSFEKMNTRGEVYTLSYPEEGDMTAEEAIALAKAAIVASYGTTEEEFDRMGVYPTFMERGWDPEFPDEPAEWRIYFSSRTGVDLDLDTDDYGPDGEYKVYLNAETEEILICNWYTNDFWAKAQRVWDCGNTDTVYWHYQKPSFYGLTTEQQSYWTKLLEGKGYQVRTAEDKYHQLLDAADLELKWNDRSAVLPEDDTQAMAAWETIEKEYGMDAALLKEYCYVAQRPDWNTGTDDICITKLHTEEELRINLGEIDQYTCYIYGLNANVGSFMVSFETGTTNVVAVTRVLRSEEIQQESIIQGQLLEKNDWNGEDLREFDAAVKKLQRAVKRMKAAGLEHTEMDAVTRHYLRSLGGDKEWYPEAPAEMNAEKWFAEESEYDAMIDKDITPGQAREQYGDDSRFWPMEVQAALLPEFSCPKAGEMTQEQAVVMAVEAIVAQHGQEALDQLGDYTAGCQLYRFENEGEVTRWHIYITDDATTAQRGWRVVFALKDGSMWDAPEVTDIQAEGNG